MPVLPLRFLIPDSAARRNTRRGLFEGPLAGCVRQTLFSDAYTRTREEALFRGKGGYGVSPCHDRWEREIRGATMWLLDAQQCPTKNKFILDERRRMKQKKKRTSFH